MTALHNPQTHVRGVGVCVRAHVCMHACMCVCAHACVTHTLTHTSCVWHNIYILCKCPVSLQTKQMHATVRTNKWAKACTHTHTHTQRERERERERERACSQYLLIQKTQRAMWPCFTYQIKYLVCLECSEGGGSSQGEKLRTGSGERSRVVGSASSQTRSHLQALHWYERVNAKTASLIQ